MSRERSKRTIPCPPKCAARRRILVAGMGTSPVVLTNAVWALAYQKIGRAVTHKLEFMSGTGARNVI